MGSLQPSHVDLYTLTMETKYYLGSNIIPRSLSGPHLAIKLLLQGRIPFSIGAISDESCVSVRNKNSLVHTFENLI